MAGTVWKACGAVLIVIGAVGMLGGIAGALFGGVVFSGVMEDANECGGFLDPCDEDAMGGRAELAAYSALIGGAVFVVGLVLTIVGVALVLVGARKSQQELIAAMRTPAQ